MYANQIQIKDLALSLIHISSPGAFLGRSRLMAVSTSASSNGSIAVSYTHLGRSNTDAEILTCTLIVQREATLNFVVLLKHDLAVTDSTSSGLTVS